MPLAGRGTGEMASIDDFVQSPSDELLNSYKKDQLVKVAEHYDVELSKNLNKDELLATLKHKLVEKEVLPVLVGSLKAPEEMDSVSDVASPRVTGPVMMSKMAPVLTGLGFTFEQQKELILLQRQQETDQRQQEHQNTLALEKLRQDAHLREAELAHVQARQQLELERYKLELISEGKLQAKPDWRVRFVCSSYSVI